MDAIKVYTSILTFWLLVIAYRILPSKLEKFIMDREDARAWIIGISGGAYIAVMSSFASIVGMLLHGSINDLDTIAIVNTSEFFGAIISFILGVYFTLLTFKALCKDKTA